MSIKANVARVFSANFFMMISGIIVGFIVPIVLSLESYAYVKTYILYVGYIGFLHLGFIDGMYMKYGGKSIEEVNKSIFKGEHNIFVVSQVLITIILIIVAVIIKNSIILLLALSIVPINISVFHKLFYQSIGEFKKYTKASYIYTMIYLSLNLVLTFIFKTDEFILYCLASLVGHIIVLSVLEIKFYKEFKNIKAKYIKKDLIRNIKIGFVVLIANLGMVIFNATDLWFVKFFLNSNDFAYYSFAISMMNIIGVLISAVSMTFYNYLAKGECQKFIVKLKKYFMAIGAFTSITYFGFAMIIDMFIEKYSPSLNIIAISFATFPYMIVINGLFINLYRARKDGKKYLKVMISMVTVTIIYNIIAVINWGTKESIAIATLFAYITWFIYSCYDLGYLKLKKKEIVYLLIITSVFLMATNNFSSLIGGIMYLITFSISTSILFKKEIKNLIYKLKNKNRIL